MRLLTQRHQYDVTDSSKASVGFSLECSVFTRQMELAVSIKLVSIILHSLLYIGVRGLCFLAGCVA
jgi:hypothetical protein